MLGADRDDLAGHVAGVVAGQEDHHVGYLPGLRGPAERLPAGQLGQELLAGHLGQERVDGQAGRDRVDPDAVGGDVQRGVPGEGHHAGLGRRVVRLAGLGAPAEHRGVVDHRSPAALGHQLAQRGPGAAEGAVEGDVEDLQPLLVGHLQDRAGAAEPGVVDHHVDPAVVLHGPVDQRLDLRFVGHVAGHGGDGGVAVRLGQLGAGGGQPPLVLVADHHPGALLQAAPGGGRADAGAGRGGDHDYFAVEELVTVHAGAVHRGSPRPRLAMMSCWISSEPP
jgi:hypothetical protein